MAHIVIDIAEVRLRAESDQFLVTTSASYKRKSQIKKVHIPLTTTRYKSDTQLSEFLPNSFLYTLHCKFYTGEPSLSAVCCKQQNQFIIHTTHFRSLSIAKSRFFSKKNRAL